MATLGDRSKQQPLFSSGKRGIPVVIKRRGQYENAVATVKIPIIGISMIIEVQRPDRDYSTKDGAPIPYFLKVVGWKLGSRNSNSNSRNW